MTKTNKKRILCAGIAAALAAASLACALASRSLSRSLQAQREAERFRGGKGRFAQVTCFFPAEKEIDEESVWSFRNGLDKAYVSASVEAKEGGKLWDDAYSAAGEVTVSSGKTAGVQVPALGVGGDFFAFHPLRLRSGGYISGDDLMHDRVVLDEEAAWKIFGATDVAGMEVGISGKTYLVAGVVAREKDPASKKAYADGAGIFMAYDALSALTEAKISCYELTGEDPISGFLLSQATQTFKDASSVENSSRFGFEAIFRLLRRWSERSVDTSATAYPYWENAARIVENKMAALLLLTMVLAAFPLAIAVVWARRGLIALWARTRAAVEDGAEKRKEARYYAKHPEQAPAEAGRDAGEKSEEEKDPAYR